ncbi:Methionine vitamin-b12 [Mycena sanguinolenta]|uniref:Methionine vitamin-b12 n=1 Tax=Mycena sanguinolenta TaxID=230812 RepID=A0A8H7CLB1_9AGAR|nr:Methionine vitamin-b12 [Mycena sanguinolenta]
MSLSTLFLLWFLPSFVAGAFTFNSATSITQCDDIQISWTGGSGQGYYLSIIPIFGVPRNISIPSTDVNGTFSTPVPLSTGDQAVLALSDATGFGSGGTSQLLKVGNSLGGSCNTTSPALAYTYTLNSPLVQCQSFPFTDYGSAVQPVTILGVIPGGDSFVLNVPKGKTSFDWTADVYNGTQIIFMMVDAQGQSGGSYLDTVGLSGDASCINSQSPSSTIVPGSASTSSSTAVPAAPSSNTGVIAGSVLGALVFLAVLITLGLFFLRQRQEKKKARMAVGEFRRSRPLDPSEMDLTYDAQQNSNSPFMSTSTPSNSVFGTPSHYQHSQYLASRPETENPFHAPTQSTSHSADIEPFMEQMSSSTSAGHRKSAMAGSSNYKPSRYVVHTDAEDEDLVPNEDGVVELPPEYKESRRPARGLPTFDSPPL